MRILRKIYMHWSRRKETGWTGRRVEKVAGLESDRDRFRAIVRLHVNLDYALAWLGRESSV